MADGRRGRRGSRPLLDFSPVPFLSSTNLQSPMNYSRRSGFKFAIAALVAAAAPIAFAQSTIKIGSILSTTGPAAFLGEDMKAGMELAIDEINSKGGINGRKIEWVFYDLILRWR